MAAKSLNKVQLIGNLTKDAELKYTQGGTAVCTMIVATNRYWKDSSGNEQDEATFHRVVTWAKLAEICGQYLNKGAKVYFEGRISNREWTDNNGEKKYITEIIADDMIMLDSRNQSNQQAQPQQNEPAPPEPEPTQNQSGGNQDAPQDDADIDDIPF